MTYTAPKFDKSEHFTCLTCPNYYKFKGEVNRGSCTAFGKVAHDDWTSTNDCRFALEKESSQYLQSFDQPEDILYCEFQPGQLVKVIDLDEPDHNEWATFKIFTKIINSKRFNSTGSYLEPDWLILLSSLDKNGGEMFWVNENEICHVDQSHLIDTSDVF